MAPRLKKKFFEVDIPLTNSTIELLSYDIDSLKNRTIKLDLTRQLRGKSIEVLFRVQVEDNKATANPVKLTLLPFFIRRMLRRKISYVEDSFTAECKDAYVKIKPFLITRKKVSRAVRKALRDEAKNWLQVYVKEKTYKELFSDITGNRLQKPLSLKLKKIYPLALCEIRKLELERLKEQEKISVKTEKIKEEKRETKQEKEKTSEKKKVGKKAEDREKKSK
jgi:ribosomal protein S3AE